MTTVEFELMKLSQGLLETHARLVLAGWKFKVYEQHKQWWGDSSLLTRYWEVFDNTSRWVTTRETLEEAIITASERDARLRNYLRY